MVVDSVIGKVASVTPSITPSQLSVAVGGVNVVISHWAISVSNWSWSVIGVKVSSITISWFCVVTFPVESV